MKLSITKLLALMAAFLMILQVLPVSAHAENLDAEEALEEAPAVIAEDNADNELPAEEAAGLSEEQEIPSETPADAESADESEVILNQDEGSEPEDAAFSDIGDDTEPTATEVIAGNSIEIIEDENFSSDDEQETEVLPEEPSTDESTDVMAVDDPGGIDYEAIEAEYGMEFDDIYESFPELTLQEEVDILYDGSWIKYAIYNEDHAYVKIKHETEIYSDSDLADEDLICLINDRDMLLLATEHCQRWNTVSVHVWLMTPDMEMIDGYIFEKDLVNITFPDEEAFRLAGSHDHGELTVGQLTLPVFLADVSFPEPDEVILETENSIKEEVASVPEESVMPSSIEETGPESGKDSETEPETVNTPVLRGTLLKMSSSASGLSDGQSLIVYRGDDLQQYVRARDGSATTATYRHYVTVSANGTAKNFDALCLNAKRSSSANGFTASLINGRDYNPLGTTLTAEQKAKADGMFWILLETNFSDPFDTAISQWAVWKYGGGTDYDSNVAKVSNIAAGNGFQYDTETMRAKINALVDGATSFVANGGVPVTTIEATASEVTRTTEGHSQVTVWLNSNGSRCRIAKSQLPQSTVAGYDSEDRNYYYFQPTASFTIDFTADELTFEIEAWSRYDQYEYWVGDVSTGSRQDMGFIVYTGDTGASANLTVKAVKVYGNIRILKRDADTGEALSGVSFEILNASRQRIMTGTTGSDGVLLVAQLEPGDYYVHEISVPAGYEAEDTYYPVTISENDQTVEVTVENRRIMGTIKVHKVAAGSQEPIMGVTFDVIDGTTGNTVCTLITDANGEAETPSLPIGTYYLHETGAPSQYVISQTDYPAVITADQRYPMISIENEMQMGAVRVSKRNGEDDHPIPGVVFEILDSTGNVVEQMTTDENGQAVSGQLVHGEYTVREASTPEGYIPSDARQAVTIIADQISELSFTNIPIRFQVEIIKKDGLTGQPLSGAEFTIVRKRGLPSHGQDGIGETVAVITTGEDGKALSDSLTWGEYEITETRIPEHYLDGGFTTIVTGTENGKVYSVEVENQPVSGQIRIVKTDALDGHPIEGVIFDIYQGGHHIGSMTTNSKGIAVSGPLDKGKYSVKERSNPEGYVYDLFAAECEVVSDQTTELYATNQPLQLRIEIIKTDSLTHQPLPGAVFTVVRKSGLPSHGDEGVNEIVAVLVTGEDGKAVSDLLTWGEYQVTETTVPDGYLDEGYTATAAIEILK